MQNLKYHLVDFIILFFTFAGVGIMYESYKLFKAPISHMPLASPILLIVGTIVMAGAMFSRKLWKEKATQP